jgi:hypothetical protein
VVVVGMDYEVSSDLFDFDVQEKEPYWLLVHKVMKEALLANSKCFLPSLH